MDAVKRYLSSLGWKRAMDFHGEVTFTSPDSQEQLRIDGEWWTLGRFTDSDIEVPDFGAMAVGRYVDTDEGQTLNELIEAGVV